MILQLEQIALNFDKTSEGEKAKEMLNYLKSDLKVQLKDNNGNSINKNVPPPDPSAIDDNSGKTVKQKMIEAEEQKKLQEMQTEQNQNDPFAPRSAPQNKK